MPNYTDFKKTFCDCCKTKKDGNCRLGLQHDRSIADNANFIDWEAVVNNKDFPEHDYSRCDSVYVRDNITFFIEQKNIEWFRLKTKEVADESKKLKKPEDVVNELKEKFEKSVQMFEADGNILREKEFVLSCDLNPVSVDGRWLSIFKHDLRNKYFPSITAKGLKCGDCTEIAYDIIYNTKF